MNLVLVKAVSAVLWISAVSAAGLVAGVGSMSGWLLLATVGVVPPLALISRLDGERKTMSESIGEVLR
jgi:hypothetical protein